MEMDITEIKEKFGINPDETGNRPRAWFIVTEIDDESTSGNAEIGHLCVRTRDGGSNPICMDALQKPNCVGTAEDTFDCTYRYYYYKPL